MVISKTLKAYIERNIADKVQIKQDKIYEEEHKTFDKLRPELDKMFTEYIDHCRKHIQAHGLNPDDYGYTDYSNPQGKPHIFPYRRAPYRTIQDIIQDIMIRIELDEIPKNEIKNFIDNFEVTEEMLKKER